MGNNHSYVTTPMTNNQPCQKTRSSTTDFGITQITPNKAKSIGHRSIATQWRKRWSTNSPLHLHIKHQSIIHTLFPLNWSCFSPRQQSIQKNYTQRDLLELLVMLGVHYFDYPKFHGILVLLIILWFPKLHWIAYLRPLSFDPTNFASLLPSLLCFWTCS